MAAKVTSATSPFIETRQLPAGRSVWAAAPLMFAAVAVVPSPVAATPATHLLTEVPKARGWIARSIAAVRALGSDWDGYGADPIAPQTIATMEFLLSSLLPDRAVSGSIVPGADGSLQAEWHLEEVELGLIVEANGEVSTWVRPVGGDHETEAHGIAARNLFWSVANSALV